MPSSMAGSSESPPNWLELPRDVTFSILSRLCAVDILTIAQNVCSAWFNICKDPLMWRTIDMSNTGDPDSEFDLEEMCRNAVDRSCGNLVDINVEYFGTDDILKYITDSSNQIKRLRLVCCYHVSDEGLSEAVAELPLLEELDLTLCQFSPETLVTVGQLCPRLKSLKLNHEVAAYSGIFENEDEHNEEAIAISKNMPELRHLQLVGNSMTVKGLEAILDGCAKLESLDLRRCIHIDDTDRDLHKRCAKQIKELRLPYDSMKGYGFCTGFPDDGSWYEDNPYWSSDGYGDGFFDFSGGYDFDDEFFYYDDFTRPDNYW